MGSAVAARLTKLTGNDAGVELIETTYFMHKYGIDNVRGGLFTMVELSDKEREFAQMLIAHQFDLCRQCNATDHFIADCPFL